MGTVEDMEHCPNPQLRDGSPDLRAHPNVDVTDRLPSDTDLAFVLPQPTAGGIAKLQTLYTAKYSRALSDDEAREILSHLITIVYNSYLIQLECDTDSTPENPTTTRR